MKALLIPYLPQSIVDNRNLLEIGLEIETIQDTIQDERRSEILLEFEEEDPQSTG